jgi:hypothetical protein
MKIALVTEVTHATAEQMKKTSARIRRIAFKILKKKQVQLESTMKTALFSEEILATAWLMQKRVKITLKKALTKVRALFLLQRCSKGTGHFGHIIQKGLYML